MVRPDGKTLLLHVASGGHSVPEAQEPPPEALGHPERLHFPLLDARNRLGHQECQEQRLQCCVIARRLIGAWPT